MVEDVLVAIPPTDITEILIQGTGEEDHVPHMVEEDHDPHMVGGTMTYLGDAGNGRCLLGAVVTVGRANQLHYSSDNL